MYLKQYHTFLYIFTWCSLSVGPTGPTQKLFFVKFSLPVNFVVLIRVLMDPDPKHLGRETDPDSEKLYGSLRIWIRNTALREPFIRKVYLHFFLISIRFTINLVSSKQCCGSEIIIFGSGSALGLISDPDLDPDSDPDPACLTKVIRLYLMCPQESIAQRFSSHFRR
jgi:hypothetical protein